MARVGFIGLGIMGGPMAANILARGHALTVLDLDPAAMARLVAKGARAGDTPAAVARDSEVVITMLPDAPDVERVALGADGIAGALPPGATMVDMSTSSPATTRRIGAALAARGCHMVDCPVGKTAEHAASGTLTLMAGGDAAAIARVRPILDCMGTDFFHCGGLGNGHAMKATNNLLATTLVALNAETLCAGMRAGLTLETMLSVMRTTMAWNNQLAIAMPARGLRGDFEPGFTMRLAHKDCRIAVEMIEGMGLRAAVGRATLAACQEALDAGLGGRDVGALLKLREEQAGIEVRLPAAP
jgi:4-hydroxybutyrate dehydrogenase/sulfolactaldehyde 3-reductase